MYIYECNACGHRRLGDHTLSTSRCPSCGALSFGQMSRRYVQMASRLDGTHTGKMSEVDLQFVQQALLAA